MVVILLALGIGEGRAVRSTFVTSSRHCGHALIKIYLYANAATLLADFWAEVGPV